MAENFLDELEEPLTYLLEMHALFGSLALETSENVTTDENERRARHARVVEVGRRGLIDLGLTEENLGSIMATIAKRVHTADNFSISKMAIISVLSNRYSLNGEIIFNALFSALIAMDLATFDEGKCLFTLTPKGLEKFGLTR